ncbi:MAG TPA: NlpC/P60 family protein [Gaiellaceae bacterium]|nr:NlpC/P60 family protein [Gaiellaceae bacterium]
MPLPRATFAWFLAAGCAAALAGDLSAATPKQRIAEKQAEAKKVLAQVNALDRRFEASVEAWNGAKLQLAATKRDLAAARTRLRTAERERRIATARVRARLVALYESDADQTTISILLGATTLSDLIDRLDAARQIAAADHRLAVQTARAQARFAAAAARAGALERQRAQDVTRLDGERRQIGTLLTRQQRLLSSVRSEVARLRAEEARRQARLKAQAEARLAREAELRREAEARAKAAAAAAAAAAKARQAAAPPPPAAAAAPPPPAAPAAPAATTTTGGPAPPATTTAAPPAPSAVLPGGHPEAAQIALKYLGVPYVWGGASPAGFDCSGLVLYVYAQLGIALPHYAAAQYSLGVPVPRAELQPGDLVFFDNLDHVGIYIGGGEMVHAPQTGDVVKITPLSAFGDRYVGARRL